jgi:hypothetical protein
MSFQQMKTVIANAYNQNAEYVRMKNASGVFEGKRRIPVLSGDSGTGKTACVEEFAKERGFELLRIDCSFEPANFLVVHLHQALGRFRKDSSGTIILLDNINEADEEWLSLLDQYSRNFLDATMKRGKVDDQGEVIHPVEWTSHAVKVASIPEQIFVVGEMRPE